MTRRRIVTAVVIVLVILLAGAFSVGFFRLDYALGAQQVYETLNIDAEVLENGGLRITEHWQVQYNRRDTPYWNHSIFIGKSDASGVQDFSVYDTDYGREYEFETDVTAFTAGERACYIVDAGNWYELGWNFPHIDSGVRNFSITYTLNDVVANYADADELLYTFVPESNTFPVRRFSLTLRFPNSTGSTEALHVWLHCEEGGDWELVDPRILTADASNLTARTMVGIRLLMPPDSVQGQGFLSDSYIVDQALADEAVAGSAEGAGGLNRYRHFSVLLSILGAVAAVVVAVVLLVRCEKRAKTGLDAEVKTTKEMPSCIRPAVVSRLYYYENSDGGKDGGEGFAISATVLALMHKRWITFAAGGDSGQETLITVSDEGRSPAEGEEKALVELFRAVAKQFDGPFTLAQLKEYGDKNSTRVGKLLSAYGEAVRRKFSRLGWVRPVRFFNTVTGWAALVALVLCAIVLVFGGFVGKGILAGGLLLAAVLCGFYAAFRMRLTEKGIAELMKWRGFVKYIREYSLLCEDAQSELCLWGDYLVYAATFGLAKTATAEMALLYTRLSEEKPMAAAANGDFVPEMVLQNPLDGYFGSETTDESEKAEQDFWRYSAFVNDVAKTFRELRRGAGMGGKTLGGTINQTLAGLGKRFGTK